MFFFSSRRRHTSYWRDWSSDVCSSDLGDDLGDFDPAIAVRMPTIDKIIPADAADLFVANSGTSMRFLTALVALGQGRSEERRVGKESRTRGEPYAYEQQRRWLMRW